MAPENILLCSRWPTGLLQPVDSRQMHGLTFQNLWALCSALFQCNCLHALGSKYCPSPFCCLSLCKTFSITKTSSSLSSSRPRTKPNFFASLGIHSRTATNSYLGMSIAPLFISLEGLYAVLWLFLCLTCLPHFIFKSSLWFPLAPHSHNAWWHSAGHISGHNQWLVNAVIRELSLQFGDSCGQVLFVCENVKSRPLLRLQCDLNLPIGSSVKGHPECKEGAPSKYGTVGTGKVPSKNNRQIEAM